VASTGGGVTLLPFIARGSSPSAGMNLLSWERLRSDPAKLEAFREAAAKATK
jgi:hypothetical protein